MSITRITTIAPLVVYQKNLLSYTVAQCETIWLFFIYERK